MNNGLEQIGLKFQLIADRFHSKNHSFQWLALSPSLCGYFPFEWGNHISLSANTNCKDFAIAFSFVFNVADIFRCHWSFHIWSLHITTKIIPSDIHNFTKIWFNFLFLWSVSNQKTCNHFVPNIQQRSRNVLTEVRKPLDLVSIYSTSRSSTCVNQMYGW